MALRKEKHMYPAVCKWLRNLLRSKYKRAEVHVFDTSNITLSKFLVNTQYHRFFEAYQTFEIQVDITGIIKSGRRAHLAFVECKLRKISLKDLSQLLGYSKVATPLLSMIISPEGMSRSLELLFNVWRRYDILYYGRDKHLLIGKWNWDREEVDPSSIVPRGTSL